MKRIDGRIRTKEELERYVEVLVHKLEERKFRDEWLTDRIDQLLVLHQRLVRYERSGATSANEYWDAVAANVN